MKFAFLVASSLVTAAPMVNIDFITEAGCPPCQEAITGVVNDMVNADGVSGIINMAQHPFGNNYYTTSECGGAPYDPDVRHCWAKACIDTASPAADCFTGAIVTQHGPSEMEVNKMEACAISHTNSWEEYWPFLVCMEANYEQSGVSAAQTCAKKTSLDYSALMDCYKGKEGDDSLLREAKATIDHPGTPSLYINGQLLNDINSVLQAVCEAYTGPAPAGCSKVSVEANSTFHSKTNISSCF